MQANSVILMPVMLLVVTWAAHCAAQELPGDPAKGRAFAEAQCSECHIVGAGDDRDRDPTLSFARIANMPSTTSLSLHAFLTTPHARMPNYRLTREEIDDVVAYLLSLRGQ